jgi:hypothetical protein
MSKNIMQYLFSKTTTGALVFVAALILMMCPVPFLMLTSTQMMLTSIAAIGFLAWVTLHWREKPRDEREELHQFLAARLAYFVGVSILMIGVLSQSLVMHKVEIWMVGALVGMVLAKLVSQAITEKYN